MMRELSRIEVFGLVALAIGGLFYLIDWLWRKLPPYDPPHDSGGGGPA
jgi:hypothetical protein